MDYPEGKLGRNLLEAPLSRWTHCQAAWYGTGTVRYGIIVPVRTIELWQD